MLRISFTVLVAAVVSFSATAQDVGIRGPASVPTAELQTESTRRSVFFVELEEAPVLRYDGSLPQFDEPGRRENGTVDVSSPSAAAYAAFLEAEQNERLTTMATVTGRSLEPMFRYRFTTNGLALPLSSREARQIARLPGVKQVLPSRDLPLDTDRGPEWIGAMEIWQGNDVPMATQGEGVIVGVIDSGVNSDHPSFAAQAGDGYMHTNPLGDGNYLGFCAEEGNEDFCNAKTIGAYDFTFDVVQGDPNAFELPTPEDEDSHGSHTASTAAGNQTKVDFAGLTLDISGVAPRANLVIFDGCYVRISDGAGLCPFVSTLASVEQAVADNLVNVINYSIGGGVNPYADTVSQAFLAATEAGILIAASAGNSGPTPSSLGHQEPWTISTGAMTHDREFSNDVSVFPGVMNGLGRPDLLDILAIQGTGPVLEADLDAPLVWAGAIDMDNVEGCDAFVENSFDGSIALISRGSCAFVDKVVNATEAGAVGVIVYNNRAGPPIVMGGLEDGATTISSVMIRQQAGEDIIEFLDTHPTATALINFATSQNFNNPGDVLADFSSRGPNSAFDVLKPDVTNPGRNILAATASFEDTTPPEAGLLSGTSMSSPHTAGSGALLKALYPTWSPMEIKSALMLTAKTSDLFIEDEETPATPFDRGQGRVQANIAAQTGLVMDESAAAFAAADPALGGNPADLNLPGLMSSTCFPSCTFTRSFTNVTGAVETWSLSGSDDSEAVIVKGNGEPSDPFLQGIDFAFDSEELLLGLGRSGDVEITIDTSFTEPGSWSFGEVALTPTGSSAPLHMTVAVQSVAEFADNPAFVSKSGPAVVARGAQFDYQIDVANGPFGADTTLVDELPDELGFVGFKSSSAENGTVSNLAFDEASGQITADLELDAAVLDLVDAGSPFGSFVDLVAEGITPQPCSAICDEAYINFTNLPSFTYNGVSYTSLLVASNGFVAPGQTFSGLSFINPLMPDAAAPNNVIAPFWTDFDLDGTDPDDTGAGNIYVGLFTLTSGGSALIVQWQDAQLFDAPGIDATFQIQIFSDDSVLPGVISIVYADVPEEPIPFTVGVEDEAGVIGTSYYFNDGFGTELGTRPAAESQLGVETGVGGTASVVFTVQAPTTEADLTNTVTVSDAEDTLTATAVTAVRDNPDAVLCSSFEQADADCEFLID